MTNAETREKESVAIIIQSIQLHGEPRVRHAADGRLDRKRIHTCKFRIAGAGLIQNELENVELSLAH